ncbi:MAG: ABC transporter permease subunit [Oscillospiraceae bacterium]|nr:ABC transporter permease subunit [Oscillospiraceae bacterium]
MNAGIVKKQGFLWEIKHNKTLYFMCAPALVLLLMFSYLPMGGIYMAFTKFNVVDGIFGSPFVGFQNFVYFFSGNPYAWQVISNTLILNFWGIILGTVLPISLAIFMNEIKSGPFKKLSQGAMFFPYFLSWVVVGAILYGFLTSNFRIDRQTGETIVTGANGVMNRLLMGLGVNPIRWYAEPRFWKAIIIFLNVWKWSGYNSIIYMAAMSGFDGSLYEAATIDGASRFQQITRLTIPMLKPTVVVLVLMSIGRIFFGDTGMIWGVVGQNSTVSDAVNVIDTYVYSSMRTMGFGYSTAIGICQSIMGLIMIMLANFSAKKINDGEGLF